MKNVRVLPVIYVLQTSGSMSGRPISELNYIVNGTLEEFKRQYLSTDVDVRISCLTFGDGIEWASYNAEADNLQITFSASGFAGLGLALQELNRKLTRTGSDSILSGRITFPIIVFVSNGVFGDDFETPLQVLKTNRWYEMARKFCFIAGDDYEIKNLEKLTDTCETILRGQDIDLFSRLIQDYTRDETIHTCIFSCSSSLGIRSDSDSITANAAMFDPLTVSESASWSLGGWTDWNEWDDGDAYNDGLQVDRGQDEVSNNEESQSQIHTQRHRCRVCDHVVPNDAIFCPFCGIKLSIDKPAVDIKEVEFSAIAPKQLIKGDYSIVNVVIYEKTSRYIVDSIIKEKDEPVQESRSGIHSVKEDSLIRIVLSSADIEIDDNEETGVWKGDHLIFSFAVMLPEQFKKRQILFTASVFINDVIACKLKFIVKCSSPIVQRISVSREDIFSAFVSYASQDRKIVAAIVQGIQKARPDMDIFFDVDGLRSGENWEMALKREIECRDILYLCWSHFARDSKWVDAEWRFAFERKGAECIEPIPIESPENCPPPEELSHKHFNDKLLYIINAVNNA